MQRGANRRFRRQKSHNPITVMRIDDTDKRYLDPEDGLRIDAAAGNRSMNKGEFARKVSPTAGESRHHLKDVLMGREPLSDDYAGRIAKALGCGIDGLWRIIEGFDYGDFSKYPSFTIVTPTKLPPIWKADRFFNGGRPVWEDLEAGFITKKQESSPALRSY